jgi:hypothetical protein
MGYFEAKTVSFPTNREELIQNVTQIWNSLTQELADNLLNSMPKRWKSLLEEKDNKILGGTNG